jgi:hypothetical protein
MAMAALLQLLFNMCLLRQAPQDIPYSKTLLNVLILIYAVIAFLTLAPPDDFLKTLMEITFEMSVTAGFVWGLLAASNKLPRYCQTLCAFLGTDALIGFFALPVLAASASAYWNTEVVIAALTALILWHWLVCGHIIRHALSQSLSFGLGVAFLYDVGFYQLMAWLFPVSDA